MPRDVISASPAELQAALQRALVLHQRGQLVEAEVMYRNILKVAADHFDARHLLGAVRYQQGRHAEALELITVAIETIPNAPNAIVALNNQGMVLKELKRYAEALASYDKALAIKPDYVDALNNRGNALRALKRHEEALASYDKALAIKPDYVDALNNRGNALRALKRHEEALASYDQALAIKPDYADALNNLGNTLSALKRHEEALASYDRVLAIKPDYADALNNRGNALQILKRHEEALASYDKALSIKPDYADAFNNRGNALKELKRFDEALASYDKAIVLKPDYTDAFYNQGLALQELKRFDEALASYDKALAIRPDYADAFNNRGNALKELERLDEALASYDKAIALKPDYAAAFNNQGLALQELKRFDEALASYDKALSIKPDYADAFNNRGNALGELKRFEEALASYDNAIALKPDYAAAFNNQGLVLQELKRFDEALASADKAIILKPDYAEAFNSRGLVLQKLKRFEEALASYEHALKVRPDYTEAHWNEALLRLLTGDFIPGWVKHEWRWKNKSLALIKRNFSQPLWLGADAIDGKVILLYSEQGFGDTIQFSRYVPLVAARGASVILEVERPLRELMTTLTGATQTISKGNPLPDFDYHCPLLSLPLAFGTRLETVPSASPYLRVPTQALQHWTTRLGPSDRPRIGICWAGRSTFKEDQNRSIGLSPMLPLLSNADVQFFSLQKDLRAGDAEILSSHRQITHLGKDIGTFSDTAAIISLMDLVISSDTSIVHLAGALGKPIWILLQFVPDWRWLLDRDDSPWYPTARLFRQDETRNWNAVIARVQTALHEHVCSLRG